jgi:hypothetical protein
VRSLQHERDASLVAICRTAARARLASATDFVRGLRAEHLQSFWYSASPYALALIGSFVGLLWATAAPRGGADAADCRRRLDEYRWTLRLASKSAEMLERAAALLATSTGALVKAIPGAGADGQRDAAAAAEDGDEDEVVSGEDEAVSGEDEAEGAEEVWPLDQGLQDDLSMGVSPVEYAEAPMDMFWADNPMSPASPFASLAGFHDVGAVSKYTNDEARRL